MPKRLAAAAVAASLLGGGAVAVLAAPAVASADSAPAATAPARKAPGAWVKDALAPLVTDGTITQVQADAVAKALEAARPERSDGPGGGPGLAVAAKALGMDADALRTELRSGKTIAQVAQEKGVDVQTVIDAIVADMRQHLAQGVQDGRLTQAQADERARHATERATALVNGQRPEGPPPGEAPDGQGSSTTT